MVAFSLLVRGALALGILGASAAAPQDELEVQRRFATELELRTESFELSGSDQRMPLHAREQAEEVEVVDTCTDAADPLARFTRVYRTITGSTRIGGEGRDRPARTASAGLEGREVVFEREDDGSWTRTCADDDVPAGQLRRLRADLSLAVFLPPDDLEPGKSHAVDAGALARLVSPLVERHRRPRVPDGERDPARGGLDLAPSGLTEPIGALLAGAEGTLTVTPRERAEDDELPRNATLAFRLEATFDGSAGLQRGGGDAEDEVAIVYEGTGTLAWDPEDGRIAIACDGEVELDERFRVTVESLGRTAELAGVLAMTGTLALEAEERRE